MNALLKPPPRAPSHPHPQAPPTTFSPGRAAAEMQLRGWRLLLPFIYLIASLAGLAGLVGSAAGVILRPWLVGVMRVVDPTAVTATPGVPPIVPVMVTLSATLLIGGLAGIVRGERLERRREDLLKLAEAMQRAERLDESDPELEGPRLAG